MEEDASSGPLSQDEIAAELKALAKNANMALDALGGEPLTARGAQVLPPALSTGVPRS